MNHRGLLKRVLAMVRDDALKMVEVSPPVGKPGSKEFRPAVKAPALELLLRRAEVAVLTASASTARPDGFPSSTPGNGNPGGGKGGRRLMAVVEDGERDLVPTSSTEAAALAGPGVSDPTVRAGRDVVCALRNLQQSLEQLGAALGRWDRIRSTVDVGESAAMCWWARQLGLPWDPMWEPWRVTDFAGVIDQPWPEPRKVCSTVYWFTRNHGRLPTDRELTQALERAVVRVTAKWN